jgi:hypothetical protein
MSSTKHKPHVLPEKKPLSFYKDSKGSWRTQSLFVEFERPPHGALWTIGEEDYTDKDNRFFPSLRKIYLNYSHVPGYEHSFITEVIGSYPLWVRLSGSSFIAKHIQEWREELEVKIKSRAIQALITQSRTDKGTAAAKYLADMGWKGSSRGRPSKKEKQVYLEDSKRHNQEVKDDLKRISLISVIGK